MTHIRSYQRAKGNSALLLNRDIHLTRFNTALPAAPLDVAGLLHINSSAVTVMDRFCSAPSVFGYVLASILKISVSPLTA
jgi:hypothetical protein